MLKKIIFFTTAFFIIDYKEPYSQEINQIELYPVQADKFIESIDKDSKISGSILAGLEIGKISGKVNNDDIFIAPPKNIDKTICISGVTRSGRFKSENLFFAERIAKKYSLAKVNNITINGKKYLKETYNDDFALKAYQSDFCDCCEKNATYYPRIGKINFDNKLHIKVNSAGQKISAEIYDTENASIKIIGECNYNKSKANLTFDTICSFSLDKIIDKNLTLQIMLDDGFKIEKQDFLVKL